MTTAPTYQSFAVMSGDQVQLNFTVTDNDSTAVNLTGGNGRFALARTVADTPAIDSNASPQTATVTVTNAASGLVNVVITDENTEALTGDYYWEFKWTDVTGREAVVARGVMTFDENLT
jgi:hypothetical protein